MTRRELVNHIESVCQLMGGYTHGNITITRVSDGWQVESNDPDLATIVWPELDMAITDLFSIVELLDPEVDSITLN